MKTALYLIHALSPLHAGTGQSVGAIDLPIAREKPTGIPLVPGSSVKGALRARCEDEALRVTIFGPDGAQASEHAGAVQFSDARLLLLPVRSIAGTFAWVTSPYLLQRFARDAKEAKVESLPLPPSPANESDCLTATGAAIRTSVNSRPKVVLEDLDFTPSSNAPSEIAVGKLADVLAGMLFPGKEKDDEEWRKGLKTRLCLVHDDVMSLLLETATEVVARIKLDADTKTVDSASGALWYEEALPTESVLYGLTAASDVTDKQLNGQTKRKAMTASELLNAVAAIPKGTLQLGGKSTVGRGVCTLQVVNDVAKPNHGGKAGAK
jgi:CRISPR-associated protein Cmr4